MPLFARADYDAALSDAIDSLPPWADEALGDAVIRVEQAPRANSLLPEPGLRVIVYREPSLTRARSRDELVRFAGSDLARALAWQLDLPAATDDALALTAAVSD
jgi:hypothetical protein